PPVPEIESAPEPVTWTVTALTSMPTKFPPPATEPSADSVRLPLTVERLPLTATDCEANADSADVPVRLTVFAKVTVLNRLPDEPIASPAVKPGSALTCTVSMALPRLSVSVPEGLP